MIPRPAGLVGRPAHLAIFPDEKTLCLDDHQNMCLEPGVLHVDLAAGTNSGSDVTITNMTSTSEIVKVLAFLPATPGLSDRTVEYVAGSGKAVKANGTDDRNNQLLIVWIAR